MINSYESSRLVVHEFHRCRKSEKSAPGLRSYVHYQFETHQNRGIEEASRLNSLLMNTPNRALIAETDKSVLVLCWEKVPDEELLELIHRSQSREAMAQMVDRYAPMVIGVVARHLRNQTTREEAFQATFLVLFQSARKIRKKTSLASFLFGVALRVSKRQRAQECQNMKRLSNQEYQDVDSLHTEKSIDPFDVLAKRLQTSVLDEELSQLPESLRAPLVDHYFAGKSAPEIASAMNLSVSAVEGRIKRGKQRLRSRLACRGVSMTACLVALQSQSNDSAAAGYENMIESVLEFGTDPNFLNATSLTEESNKNLRKLIQGELQMKSFTTPPWFFWSGSVCLITIVGLGMLQVSNGSNQAASNQSFNTILSTDTSLLEPDVPLLQMGGMGDMGGRGLGGMGGGMVGFGAGFGTGQGPAAREVVNWTSEPANAPKWLVDKTGSENAVDDEAVVQEINKKLNERIPNFSVDAPLSEFATMMSEMLGVDVSFDMSSLEDSGIEPDVKVTLRRNTPAKAKDILSQVLSGHDLVYFIKYDSIIIASSHDFGLAYYDLSYIFPDSSTLTDLIHAIETSVTPEIWETSNGEGTITSVGSVLVVRAPRETHEGIEEFLREIAKQSKGNLLKPPAKVIGATTGDGKNPTSGSVDLTPNRAP